MYYIKGKSFETSLILSSYPEWGEVSINNKIKLYSYTPKPINLSDWKGEFEWSDNRGLLEHITVWVENSCLIDHDGVDVPKEMYEILRDIGVDTFLFE